MFLEDFCIKFVGFDSYLGVLPGICVRTQDTPAVGRICALLCSRK